MTPAAIAGPSQLGKVRPCSPSTAVAVWLSLPAVMVNAVKRAGPPQSERVNRCVESGANATRPQAMLLAQFPAAQVIPGRVALRSRAMGDNYDAPVPRFSS